MAALYLTHDNGILGKKGEALSFRRSRAEKAETIPPAMIDQVMVLGRGSVTTPALHLLMENDVPVHFIDGKGRYKGGFSSRPQPRRSGPWQLPEAWWWENS